MPAARESRKSPRASAWARPDAEPGADFLLSAQERARPCALLTPQEKRLRDSDVAGRLQTGARGSGRHATRAGCQDANPQRGDSPERGNREARRAGREHQLEQRHLIANALTQRTQWAIPTVLDNEHSLAGQDRDREPQPPPAPTGQRAPPHISDR